MFTSNNHLNVGSQGEAIAVDYLLRNRYEILERNYRFKRAEIDIIALKDQLLVFVEVKARKSSKFGLPEESVNLKKAQNIQLAAENYIYETSWEKDIRFDVISIMIGSKPEVHHIEDAF